MRILRAADQPVAAWKNGGGRTRSVALCPPQAGLDDFDWRVSVAEVAVDGPFSRFPGVDRTLVLLSGAGMRLVADEDRIELRHPGDRWDFPGEWAVVGALHDGPTLDLNLMVRRGRADARIDVVPAGAGPFDGLVVVIDGRVSIDGQDLEVGDAVRGVGITLSGTGHVAHVHGDVELGAC